MLPSVLQNYILIKSPFGRANMDDEKDYYWTRTFIFSCVLGLFLVVTWPITRGFFDIGFIQRIIFAITASSIFLMSILVINPQLGSPTIFTRIKRLKMRLLILLLALISSIAILFAWANGELVVSMNDSLANSFILFLMFLAGLGLFSYTVSILVRMGISLKEEETPDADWDDLEFNSDLYYCLTGHGLDFTERQRRSKIYTKFLEHMRVEHIPNQMKEGNFTKKHMKFETFYKNCENEYFDILSDQFNWDLTVKKELFEMIRNEKGEVRIKQYLIEELYKQITEQWVEKIIYPQTIFSIVVLLEMLRKIDKEEKDLRDGIGSNKSSLLEFFIDPESNMNKQRIHKDRIQIFCTILISYSEYLAEYQGPVLCDQKDAQTINEITQIVTSKMDNRIHRAHKDQVLTGIGTYDPIVIKNPEVDELLKEETLELIRERLSSDDFFPLPAPYEANQNYDTTKIDEIMSKWKNRG